MNDPNGGGVNWTATCSAADCGSFNPTGTASGTATTYTPPATVPNPATVTISATSVSDTSKSVSGNVTITPAATPVLADGTYVFQISGFDINGPYTVAGAFTIAAGAITGGEQDLSDPVGRYMNTFVTANSHVTAAGANIQITLDTGNGRIGLSGVETLRATMVSATRFLLSNFDPTAAGTGSLDLQTGNAMPDGGYAFAVSGNDMNGEPLAIGGVMNFSGGALDLAGSVFDLSLFNTAANHASLLAKQGFKSGSVSAPDAFGRVTIMLAPVSVSAVPAFAFAGYIIGTNRIQLVESSDASDVLNANSGGSALGQGANTGQFSATSASVVNQSYAHGVGGVDPKGAAVMSGVFALQANGVLGGVVAVNDLTNIGAWNIGGTYTVDATGRVTVFATSFTSPTNAAPPAGALTWELYLDGNGNAMVMGADAFQTTQGIAYGQGGNFTLDGAYALGGQGLLAGQTPEPWSAVGPVTATNAQLSGSTDYTAITAAPQSAVTLTGTQDAAQSALHLTGLDATDFSTTNDFAYYPVSGNRLWAIQTDNQGLSLLLMEGVAH